MATPGQILRALEPFGNQSFLQFGLPLGEIGGPLRARRRQACPSNGVQGRLRACLCRLTCLLSLLSLFPLPVPCLRHRMAPMT
jgi:hypothetical protein